MSIQWLYMILDKRIVVRVNSEEYQIWKNEFENVSNTIRFIMRIFCDSRAQKRKKVKWNKKHSR